MRAERLKQERRRKILTVTGFTTAAVLVVGLLAFAVFMEVRSRVIPGVAEYEVGSYVHVGTGETVAYEQSPPVGGDHWSSWQNCAVYTEPVTTELAVHALEHGAVWITYDPELAQEEVDELAGMYNPGDYLVISPYEGEMDAPIVASSWGRQITAETAGDEALQKFVRAYERGRDVPEPGASCSGAVSENAAEVEAMLVETGGVGAEEMEGPGDTPAEDGPAEGAEDGGSQESGGEDSEEEPAEESTE
nr:DUF3105 domain-containing protein [Nocardiopsis algeriensis]